MAPTEINTALTALAAAGVYSVYEPDTQTIYAQMQFPDPDTDDVYTEDVPCHTLKEVYDLLGE